MVHWYAVHARSRSESRVLDHLARRSVDAFVPLIEATRRYRCRRVTRLEPLFPGYLFARLGPIHRHPVEWSAVRWAPGVKSILGVDGVPTPVPDGMIEAILERIRPLGFVRPGVAFRPNARLRVSSGPLAGLEAVFDRPLSRAGRVQVFMRLMGQTRKVQVDAVDLELA